MQNKEKIKKLIINEQLLYRKKRNIETAKIKRVAFPIFVGIKDKKAMTITISQITAALSMPLTTSLLLQGLNNNLIFKTDQFLSASTLTLYAMIVTTTNILDSYQDQKKELESINRELYIIEQQKKFWHKFYKMPPQKRKDIYYKMLYDLTKPKDKNSESIKLKIKKI